MSKPKPNSIEKPIASPRRRIVRIGAIASVLVLLVLGHDWYGRAGRQKLSAVTQEYRAAGEPSCVADLNTASIADEDNAAPEWAAAAKAVNQATPAWTAFDILNRNDATREEIEPAASAVAPENVEALAHVDRAASRPGIDWGVRWVSPALFRQHQTRGPVRLTQQLLVAGALAAHHAGDDALALRRVRQILKYASDLDQLRSSYQVHLTAMEVAGTAYEVLEYVTPDLSLRGGGAAAREAMLLLPILLDDAEANRRFRHASAVERVILVDKAEALIDQRVTWEQVMTSGFSFPPALAPSAATLMKPQIYLDTRRVLRAITATADACTEPNWGLANDKIRGACELVDTSLPLHCWVMVLLPGLDHVALCSYRDRTERHLAALALAMRLSEEAQDGRLPAGVNELVPKYLPACPSDPMAAGGVALRYIPDALDPLIYSVGPDGRDDGGSDAAPDGSRTENLHRWYQKDLVLHLRRWPTRLPPSTQPSNLEDPDYRIPYR